MRITDSNITMSAGRRYAERGLGYSREERSASAVNNIFSQFAKQAESGQEGTGVSKTQAPDTGNDLHRELIGLRDNLLQELLRRMLSSGLFGGLRGTYGGFGNAMGFGGMSSGFGGLGLQAQGGMLSFTQTTYAEEETTAFHASGCAKTEDGRQIDFNVNVLMSRTFMQYTQINVPLFSEVLFDPLVINTGAAIARLKDQTFRFDLDMDGEEDNLAMPGEGSGFLALDLNEDGIINDGSELFGVKSGDGFADLAAYDSDGNGWIDENDDIFSKLKVWYKNGDGTDELVDLKTADVGAIYLGNQQTDFSLYGSAFQLNGMVRATGLFLKESGGTGTIQHVDLAKQESGMPGAESDNRMTPGSPDAASGPGMLSQRASALAITGPDSAAHNRAHPDMQTSTRAGSDSQADGEKESERTSTGREETKAERAKQRTDAERERRRAYQKRRSEKEALNKEAAVRLQKRRELRREELEALFADRKAQQEQYDEMLAEKRAEHNTLNAELQNTGALDTLADAQIEAVA